MLGKHGWRMISDPDALVCRVLRAKYFPRGDFLSAKLGSNPSFTWRSIWSSQVLLERGIRWRVGNGTKIKVWDNPWIRDPDNFFIETPKILEMADMMVSDLMIPGHYEWDVELIEDFFLERDVTAITSLPLSSLNMDDKQIWHFTKNGIYTVKSAYRLASDLFTSEVEPINGSWRKLWGLSIPPKVKFFLWRVGRDCLPTRLNLQRRGMVMPVTCVICNNDFEHIWHILINCSFAQQCWTTTGFVDIINQLANDAESISEWLHLILNKFAGFELSKVCMIAWGIWKERNCKLWKSAHKPPAATIFVAMHVLYDWIAAKQIQFTPLENTDAGLLCQLWHTPPPTYLKCNIDAAFFEQEQKTGVGMVLRNDVGEFLVGRTLLFTGLKRIEEGEAMGLQEALSWIRNMGFQKVMFELDSKRVVDALLESNPNFTEFGLIIDSCRRSINSFTDFSVCFARRQANEVAHTLARTSRSYASPTTWVEPPNHIVALLDNLCTDLHH